MEQKNKDEERKVDFAVIPHYLMEQISELEQTIQHDTGKNVILVAYESKKGH